jgi:hypothetical protein
MRDYVLISASVMTKLGLKVLRTRISHVRGDGLFNNIISTFLDILTFADERWIVHFAAVLD